VGLPPSVRPPAPRRQQQPLSDPAQAPLPEPRLPRAGPVRTPSGAGLAGTFRLSAAVAGDLRRSALLPRHDLPGRQLAVCRRYTRGFRRTREGYSAQLTAAKRIFVRPLHRRLKHGCPGLSSIPSTATEPRGSCRAPSRCAPAQAVRQRCCSIRPTKKSPVITVSYGALVCEIFLPLPNGR